LFKSAEISTFDVHERKQYFVDMTTQKDIQRMIAFAEDKGIEKGKTEMAKLMREKGFSVELICEISGLDQQTVEGL
jgi:hypothetical protein